MKELIAAALIAMGLVNVSAPYTMPLKAHEAPRTDFIAIGITDAIPTREDLEARQEAIRAEEKQKAAEAAKAERIEKIADGRIMTVLATGYCGCSYCCGKSDRITATGTRATEGRTIAADPRVLPYGTHVLINGHEYVVEDCGGDIQNNRIDIYFESHEVARCFDPQYIEIEVLK